MPQPEERLGGTLFMKVKQVMTNSVALLLLVIGIVSLPLPFPSGLPLMVIALTMFLGTSRRARVKYTRFKHRLKPGSALYRSIWYLDTALRRKKR